MLSIKAKYNILSKIKLNKMSTKFMALNFSLFLGFFY
jgi:hypothetical protein